jgi:hypothetical protein
MILYNDALGLILIALMIFGVMLVDNKQLRDYVTKIIKELSDAAEGISF